MDLKKFANNWLSASKIVYLISILSMLGFLGKAGVVFELASHFRMIYIGILVCCFVILIRKRNWKVMSLAMVMCLVNLTQFQYFYGSANYRSANRGNKNLPSRDQLTVLQMNTWAPVNKNYKAAIDVVREKKPLIVGFIELHGDWTNQLEKNLKEYPHKVILNSRGGLALFSKLPIVNHKITYVGKRKRPHITAEVEMNGRRYTILVVHTSVPMPQQFKNRNADFDQFALEVKESRNPVIVFGDFNCSPWSYYFQRLLRKSDLKDTEVGFGFQPTWFALMGIPFIPIDHVLTSKSICVLERQTGPVFGSDHLPVYVKLSMPN